MGMHDVAEMDHKSVGVLVRQPRSHQEGVDVLGAVVVRPGDDARIVEPVGKGVESPSLRCRGIPFVIAGGEVTSFHLSVRSGSLIPRESPAAAGVVGTVPTGAGASAKFEFDRGQRLMVRMTRTAATRAMTTQIPPWRMRSIRSACPAAAVALPPRPGASPTSNVSGAST